MNIFSLSDALVDRICALRPMSATFMGVPGHDTRWDDLSPAGVAAWSSLVQETEAALAALPPPKDRWEALAAEVHADWCALERDRVLHGDHLHDLNSIASPFQLVRMVFDVMDTSTQAGWEAVAQRLETLDQPLGGYRELLALGLARGEVVAARQVEAALRQGEVTTADGGFYRGLLQAYTSAPFATATFGERLTAAIDHAVAATRALCAWLRSTYLPAAPRRDGVGHDRYVRAARRFLGATLDPLETYAWGWTEVRSILNQLAALAPGETVPTMLTRLRQDPAVQAPDAESFLDLMHARQILALAVLDGVYFDVPPPVRQLDVRRAPDNGTRGAYYMAPSEDFSRPGSIWYAIGDGPVSMYDEVSTAYHEGFPGHHLQIGTQVSLSQHLSRWHRLGDGCSGYAEGWALYAEQLMGELGYYERPAYQIGMLANQLIRALRVVIDIGAHLHLPIPPDAPFHPGELWTFDRAVEVLVTWGGMTREHAESDVTRYLGWPGQAISYKVGQRVMLALREAWRTKHGADLKPFHAAVLGCGTVGLERLEAWVLGTSQGAAA
jgi:uncharacterized protein (DUF885 family)